MSSAGTGRSRLSGPEKMPEQSGQSQAEQCGSETDEEERLVGGCAGPISYDPAAPLSPGLDGHYRPIPGNDSAHENSQVSIPCRARPALLEVDNTTPRGYIVRVASPPQGKRDGATRASIPSRTVAVTGSANTTYKLRPSGWYSGRNSCPPTYMVSLLLSRPCRTTAARFRVCAEESPSSAGGEKVCAWS